MSDDNISVVPPSDPLDAPATKRDLAAYATKDDLKQALAVYATKDDLKQALAVYATKDDLKQALAAYATKDDLNAALARSNRELLTQLDQLTGRVVDEKVRKAEDRLRNDLVREIRATEESLRAELRAQHDVHRALADRIEDHERRLTRLEIP